MEEFLQTVVDGGAEFVVGGIELCGGLVFNGPGFGGNFEFELFEALFVVAAHFADGKQVAALGVEQEEQTVEEGKGAVEEWFEQAAALVIRQGVQSRWELVGAAGVEDEATREVGENLKKDALFEAFA